MEPVAIQIGIDIGQRHDPTAIAVVQVTEDVRREVRYTCRFLQRLPLGTPYPRVADRLEQIARNAVIAARQEHFEATGDAGLSEPAVSIFVDATGVGQPVVDILRETDLAITECYFTHGDRRARRPRHGPGPGDAGRAGVPAGPDRGAP